MRTGIKVLLAVVIVGALAYGLLGPVVATGHLQDVADAAAKSGYAQLLTTGSTRDSVRKAVSASVGKQSKIRIKSVTVNGDQVTVVLEEKVDSFMSGFPGLQGWFTVTAKESASALG